MVLDTELPKGPPAANGARRYLRAVRRVRQIDMFVRHGMPQKSSIMARICLTNFWCAVSAEFRVLRPAAATGMLVQRHVSPCPVRHHQRC